MSLLSAAGAGAKIGQKLVGIGKNLFGGGTSGACKQKQAQVAKIFSEEFTFSERRALCKKLDELEGCNKGSDPAGLAFEYVGGKNCKVESGNVGKQKWVRFVDAKLRQKRSLPNASPSFSTGVETLRQKNARTTVPVSQQKIQLQRLAIPVAAIIALGFAFK